MTDDYLKIPLALRRAVKEGKDYLVLELYHHSVDDIFSHPERAMFRYATSNLTWQSNKYKGKVEGNFNFDKFINKQFNSLSINLLNVKTGKDRPSFIVLNNVIKGFRVNVRAIAEGLPISDSWSVWSGRLDSISELSAEIATLNCTQELGKFSYQVATDQYGQGCPLRYGHGDCLGSETLAQKNEFYRRTFKAFGHGGCNHTFEACVARGNTKFNQGQRKLTTGGTFDRITYVKKRNWWTLGLTKKTKKVVVPVQWSPKSQDDNSSVTIPWGFGRVSAPSRTFTSADVGNQLLGLVGFLRPSEYGIEGFYAVKSADINFPVISYTQHLGTLGGTGTQVPDERFLDSGFNSRLAYLGTTCRDNSEDTFSDSAQEFPTISAVIKASLVPVFDGLNYEIIWTHNPVWITRYLMMNFRFTVIKPQWFNDLKNLVTSQLCYRIVEDDSNADIAMISDNEVANYNSGDLVRFHSSSRFKAETFEQMQVQGRSSLLSRPDIDQYGDIDFFPVLQNSGTTLKKTFLQFQFTLNGLVNESASLSDLLYGLIFPTYRGYMAFDRYAQMYIGMRQAAPNAFVRTDINPSSDNGLRLPITNVSKLHNKGGYLLIGAGQAKGEIRTEQGVAFIHSPITTSVTATNGLTLSATNFTPSSGAPSKCVLDFAGSPVVGSKIELSFLTPVAGRAEPHRLTWDWYVENNDVASIALMFMTRLQASPTFDEFWTCRVNRQNPTQLIIEYQAGFILLDKPLLHSHKAGEEVLRVVEVYENFKDPDNTNGRKDNIFDFSLAQGDDVYQSVKGTYISAIEDFTEVEILPYSAWNTIEDEREMNLLELDLRFIDNYNQAGFIVKANYIDFVVGALYGTLEVPNLAMFHQEDDVIAVRYQTLEGAVSYLPMWIMALTKNEDSVTLRVKLYLSAMFDTRVPQEEKFLESTLTQLPEGTTIEIPITGGYSSTRTGDGAADAPQDIIYKPIPYGLLPSRFHTDGSYSEVTDRVYNYEPIVFEGVEQPTQVEQLTQIDEGKTFSAKSDLHTSEFIPKPVNLEFIADARFSIITWNWVQFLDSAEYFEVQFYGDGIELPIVKTKEMSTDLTLGTYTTYEVKVRTVTFDSLSEWSDLLKII